MVTDQELLTDTFEHRIHEHLKAGEVRALLLVRPAGGRADIQVQLPAREMVGLFWSSAVPAATETFVYAHAAVQPQLQDGSGGPGRSCLRCCKGPAGGVVGERGPAEPLGQCGGQRLAGLVALALLGGASQQLAVLLPAAIHLPGG